MQVCTIIAKNYLAPARVLARSLAAHDPGARLWTLIIDDFSGYVDPAQEPFEVLTPEDVGCEPFIHMAIRYTVLELSTAVKPWLLRHLMVQTGGPVIYLDPDIRIYGSIELLDEQAASHGVALIPHNNIPIPPDGRKPSQVDVMIAGVYNLGVVAVAARPDVDRLIDWWADRLVRDCRVDPVWGYFVDQRWFDLAPGFLDDFAVVRDPQYNLAYWNLHSRTLEYRDGTYLVDDRPLAFFHFSGFDAEHPLRLSRHQNRIDVTQEPVLERLLAEYAAEVMAEGHAVSRTWPYTYEALADGTRIDDTVRALYDDFADERERQGLRVTSPFTLDGAMLLREWMREQDPRAPVGVSRALARIHEDRPDVRGAFPDLARSSEELVEWARQYGWREMPSLAWAMAPNGAGQSETGGEHESVATPEVIPATVAEESIAMQGAPWGINVIGGANRDAESRGLAPLMIAALDAEGISALPLAAEGMAGDEARTPGAMLADAPFPVNLICVQPGELSALAARAGRDLFAGRYSIGLWLWAPGRLPDQLRGAFSLVDEVWAPSAYVAEALQPIATVPLTTIRVPVQPPPGAQRPRAELGLPDDAFLFLSSVDYLGGFDQKNPLAVIEAFRTAFAEERGARLVIHCANAERDQGAHRRLLAAANGAPGIQVLDDPDRPVHTLAAHCDCYISLHRAESFGLDLATAMWRGKPVIATGYSGNLDFMTPENSMLVEYRLAPLGSAMDLAATHWAEPSVEHAAALMRRTFEDRAGAERLGARAAEELRRTHSCRAAGQLIARRLESIRATGRPRSTVDRILERPPSLAGLPLRIRRGPVPRGRGTGIRGFVRRFLLRSMRPFTRYQQEVNAELVTALEQLNERVEELRHQIARERGQLLAELRRHEQRGAESRQEE